MTKWDVYIADVPFEDIMESKVRPVVIVDDSIVATIDCIKLTSHPPRSGEYALKYWKEAGLHKPTTVRLSKVLSLSPTNLKTRIGSLHIVDILEIEKRL